MTALARAFTNEFVNYMYRHGAWPDHTTVQGRLRRLHLPSRREELSKMRNGRYVPEHYLINFLRLIIAETADAHFTQARRCLDRYVRERGIPDLAEEHLDAITSHTCTRVLPPDFDRDDSDDPTSPTDYIVHNLQSILRYPFEKMFARWLRLCAACDPQVAGPWIYWRLAQARLANGPDLDAAQAQAQAETIMGIPLRDYTARIRSWAEYNPWCVIRARTGKTDLGISLLLPIHEHAYAEVRNGCRRTSDIGPDDMIMPSNYFVYEALAEHPSIVRDKTVNPTKAMLKAMVIQHAALMRYGSPGLSYCYRFLAPEAVPLNRDRMLAGGYKATGICTGLTDFPLWERIMDFDTNEGVNMLDEPTIKYLSKHCPPAPPPT